MSATTDITPVTYDQYVALQTPVVLPTPEELFEFQVDGLRRRDLMSDADVDRLHTLVPSEPQLFLVVPERPEQLDLDGLMHLVEVNGQISRNCFDVKHLADLVETPRKAHLLLNVSDGHDRRNTRPSVSREKIAAEGRLPYTTFQGIVHAMLFPGVFTRNNLDLVGSCYGSGRVPSLCLDDGVPELRHNWHVNALPGWGAPSAGSAIGT